jgi:hypothetical protein
VNDTIKKVDHRPESEPKPEDYAMPGRTERFRQGLRKALVAPPHRSMRAPKAKERPASKGRVHKGRTRS